MRRGVSTTECRSLRRGHHGLPTLAYTRTSTSRLASGPWIASASAGSAVAPRSSGTASLAPRHRDAHTFYASSDFLAETPERHIGISVRKRIRGTGLTHQSSISSIRVVDYSRGPGMSGRRLCDSATRRSRLGDSATRRLDDSTTRRLDSRRLDDRSSCEAARGSPGWPQLQGTGCAGPGGPDIAMGAIVAGASEEDPSECAVFSPDLSIYSARGRSSWQTASAK